MFRLICSFVDICSVHSRVEFWRDLHAYLSILFVNNSPTATKILFSIGLAHLFPANNVILDGGGFLFFWDLIFDFVVIHFCCVRKANFLVRKLFRFVVHDLMPLSYKRRNRILSINIHAYLLPLLLFNRFVRSCRIGKRLSENMLRDRYRTHVNVNRKIPLEQ